MSQVFVNGPRIYPGESINFSMVVVGHDFGITTGAITANLISQSGHSQSRLRQHEYHQWLGSTQCTNLTYTIISVNENENLYLQTTSNVVSKVGNKHVISNLIKTYYSNDHHGCLDQKLLNTPVYINISLFPNCPPGFRFDKHVGCTCFKILRSEILFIDKCYIKHNTGYFQWNTTVWINAINDTIIISQHCPLGYCSLGKKMVDLATNPNDQCDFNHAGTLCGGCKDHYSLAIGSVLCIKCSSKSYTSLFLFFIAAGVILVLFILVLNLTVTQGLINGLILYANILWTYKDILSPSGEKMMIPVFQTFIAWLNLDFGIEICLVVGLTAFWKTWLQFLFPLYIWLIAGVTIIACRYSSRLTYLIGDRAVPLLATLFLLSYTKLLRTVMTVLEYGCLIVYPNKSKIFVWYLDGNLPYCKHPHVYLFVVAVTILFFCLSFTLFLLLIQCWKKIPHLRLLKWINKFTPFYDAYFAPLKDKYHYWFGTLLLVRIALLLAFTATSPTSSYVSLLFLQFTLVMLLWFASIKPVYKSKLVRMLDSISLLNLIILVGFTLYSRNGGTIVYLEVSIAMAIIQFITIVIYSMMIILYDIRNKYKIKRYASYDCIPGQDTDVSEEIFHERVQGRETFEENVHKLRDTVATY